MNHHPAYSSFLLACLTAVTLLAGSCDKVPINGDLDGMWQLMDIATPAGHVDAKPKRVYISVQLHLTMWENKLADRKYYAHFEHRGDSIRFYDFVHASLHQNTTQDDERITMQEMSEGLLDDWGVHTTDARYRIDHLSDSHLILHSNDTIISFRKM